MACKNTLVISISIQSVVFAPQILPLSVNQCSFHRVQEQMPVFVEGFDIVGGDLLTLLPQRYSPENVPISVFVVEARSLSDVGIETSGKISWDMKFPSRSTNSERYSPRTAKMSEVPSTISSLLKKGRKPSKPLPTVGSFCKLSLLSKRRFQDQLEL